MDDRHGYTWRLGIQHVARSDPYGHPKARMVMISALAIIAVVVLMLADPLHHDPAAVTRTVARVQPVPTATVATVQVASAGQMICVLPTGKARTVKVVKIP